MIGSTQALIPNLPLELSRTHASLSVQVRNDIAENKSIITHSNGWEIVREGALVTSIDFNDTYTVIGLFDTVRHEVTIDLLNSSDGSKVPEYSRVCLPDHPRIIMLSQDNTCGILTDGSVMVWRIGSFGEIDALISDAPLTGLFAKDKAVEFVSVYPPQVKLESGRTTNYNIRLSRWTLNS
jgi:hypothetical protein